MGIFLVGVGGSRNTKAREPWVRAELFGAIAVK